MANTFDWVEIRSNDVERAASFYEKVFGWKVIDRESIEGDDYLIFDTRDEPRSHTLRNGGMWCRRGNTGVLVYVLVEDIDEALERVKLHGGEILVSKIDMGSAYRAEFGDLDGNVFGLFEEKEAG